MVFDPNSYNVTGQHEFQVDPMMQGLGQALQVPQQMQQQKLRDDLMRAQTQEAQAKGDFQVGKNNFVANGGLGGGGDGTGGGGGGLQNSDLRKLYGFDSETPEQLEARAIRTSQIKAQQNKALNKSEGTETFITDRQKAQNSAKMAIDPIKDLMKNNIPGFWKAHVVGGDDETEADNTSLLAADNYMKSKGIQPTEQNLEKFHKLFRRGSNEGDTSYLKRLAKYLKETEKLAKGDSSDEKDAPLKTTFSSKAEFDEYKGGLSPERLQEFQKAMGF